MKNLFFILVFVLSGTFAFGANSNGNCLTEPEKAELINKDCNTAFIEVHVKGTLTVEDCVVHYDLTMEVTLTSVDIISGTVVMGEGCDNPGKTYTFGGEGETENGFIYELEIFSENEFISSTEFSEALRADLNRKLY